MEQLLQKSGVTSLGIPKRFYYKENYLQIPTQPIIKSILYLNWFSQPFVYILPANVILIISFLLFI